MDYVSKTTHDGRNVRVKNYKKRARRNRRRRRILFFSFIALCIFLLMRHLPLFSVKEIKCEGNSIISNEEIIAKSTISYGFNLYRTSVGKAQRLISELPYVKSVRVSRKFPNTIKIDVTECEVYGYLPLNEVYIYIDENCKMLEQSSVPPEKNVPVVEKTGVLLFESGKQIVPDDEEKTECLTAIFNALVANGILDRVLTVDVTEANKLTLFYRSGLEIFLGDSEKLEEKINIAVRTINDSLGENPKGFLDASASNTPVGTIYRESK